jgi:hypothetical protein
MAYFRIRNFKILHWQMNIYLGHTVYAIPLLIKENGFTYLFYDRQIKYKRSMMSIYRERQKTNPKCVIYCHPSPDVPRTFITTSMTKRASSTSTSEPTKPLKRLRRQGFRTVRASSVVEPTDSETNRYVTVNTGNMKGSNKILTTAPVTTPSGINHLEPLDEDSSFETGGDFVNDGEEEDLKFKKQRSTTNAVSFLNTEPVQGCLQLKFQDFLVEWLKHRSSFLDEIHRHDGLGDFLHSKTCLNCGERDGMYKCKDCGMGSSLKCAACVVSVHKDLPLHRIEVSSSNFARAAHRVRVI